MFSQLLLYLCRGFERLRDLLRVRLTRRRAHLEPCARGHACRDDAGSLSADVGVAYLSFWSGLDPERPGVCGVRKRGGGHMDDKGPGRARHLDALMWLVPLTFWDK